MSFLGTILSGTQNVMLLQYKVEQLIIDVNKLDVRQDDITARMIRLEVIIAEAQRGATARQATLPKP